MAGDITFAKTSSAYDSWVASQPLNATFLSFAGSGPLFTIDGDSITFKGAGHKFNVSRVSLSRVLLSNMFHRETAPRTGMVKARTAVSPSLIPS